MGALGLFRGKIKRKGLPMIQRIKISAVLLIALSLAFSTPAHAADKLLNPGFSADESGWTGARQTGYGNSACSGGVPNIGTWESGKLSFSYVRNTVYQDIEISVPSRITIIFEAQNRGDQVFTQWFSASLGDSTTGNFTPGYASPDVKTLSMRTNQLNETVRVAFEGQDQLWWAGCYGTRVGNIQFVVDKNTVAKPIGKKTRERLEGVVDLKIGTESHISTKPRG